MEYSRFSVMSREIIECRKCKKVIDVWYDTDVRKRPLNICDGYDDEYSLGTSSTNFLYKPEVITSNELLLYL